MNESDADHDRFIRMSEALDPPPKKRKQRPPAVTGMPKVKVHPVASVEEKRRLKHGRI